MVFPLSESYTNLRVTMLYSGFHYFPTEKLGHAHATNASCSLIFAGPKRRSRTSENTQKTGFQTKEMTIQNLDIAQK